MKYIIEFELPDNDAVSKGIKVDPVHWVYHGYSGYCKAKQKTERKKGKWIWDDEGYHCSGCWFHAHGNTLDCMDGTYRFCPHCGAEMEEE